MVENNKKTKSKRAKRRIIQKLIPLLVAVALIAVVLVFSLATGMLQKYSYSSKKADLYAYFNLTAEDEAALMIDNTYLEQKALVKDGKYYIDEDTVETYFNDNFYFNQDENSLMYTNATETITATESDFIVQNDTTYICLDFLKKFTNLSSKEYSDPNHLEVKYQWGTVSMANVNNNTQVRLLGGVKSDILTEVSEGDPVEILNPMETWSEVKTADGYIGYIENKKLTDYREEQETPVTDVTPLSIAHTLRDHKIVLGWHQIMSTDANSTFDTVTENTKGMNVISPTWFSLTDNDGNFSNIGSADYVQKAHEKGMEVWGLVDNFSQEVTTYDVLSSTQKRINLVSQLIEAAKTLGLDGINIDFENLSSECGPHFAQFIRELSIPCRENGLVLSVDNYVPKEYTQHYNRKVQGTYADYVIIMGYDEHYAGSSESGSVASFDFVSEGIENTLEDVPKEQVINGIPFFTRIWKESSELTSDAVGMQAVSDFVSQNGATPVWDESTAQNYVEFQKDGTTYKVWIEDAQSIDAKLQLIQKNELAGVACWKLGLEKAEIWDTISQYAE